MGLNGLALVLKAKGEYKESERLLTHALDINRQRLGEYHVNVAANLNNLASLATYLKDSKIRLGDLEAAEQTTCLRYQVKLYEAWARLESAAEYRQVLAKLPLLPAED